MVGSAPRYPSQRCALFHHLLTLDLVRQIPRPIVGGEPVIYQTCTPPSVKTPPTPTSNYVALDEVCAVVVSSRLFLPCRPSLGLLSFNIRGPKHVPLCTVFISAPHDVRRSTRSIARISSGRLHACTVAHSRRLRWYYGHTLYWNFQSRTYGVYRRRKFSLLVLTAEMLFGFVRVRLVQGNCSPRFMRSTMAQLPMTADAMGACKVTHD